MKKLFSIVSLCTLLALPMLAASGNWQTADFINGQSLVISNNQTLLYGATNVFTIDLGYVGRWSFASSNFVPTTGESRTNYVPSSWFWTNATTFQSTNALAGGYSTSTTMLNGPAWGDVGFYTDGNGAVPPAVITVSIIGQGSRAADVAGAPTNTMTVVFAKVPDGTNVVTSGSQANDLITLSFAANAGTNGTICTNIPTGFGTGARKIRLVSLGTSNVSSGTNVVIGRIAVTGWVP